MARPKVNKSEKVREMLASMPNATAREIVDQLAKQGVKVTPQVVYTLKGRVAKQGNGRRKVGRPAGAANGNNMNDFFAVLDLARKIGVKNLREIATRLPE
jgi:hypothetical protein